MQFDHTDVCYRQHNSIGQRHSVVGSSHFIHIECTALVVAMENHYFHPFLRRMARLEIIKCDVEDCQIQAGFWYIPFNYLTQILALKRRGCASHECTARWDP
jgi:hypothetical protein